MFHQNDLIPKDELGEEFKEDILYLFSFSDSVLSKLIKELENKRDSLNTSHLLNFIDMDIEDVAVCTRVIMYIIHMMNTHKLSSHAIKNELKELSLDEVKLTHFVEQLSKLDDNSLKGIDKLYYADLERMENNYIQRISSYENYSYVSNENDDFQGLVPIIRLQLEISDIYSDKIKTQDVYHTLDSLNSMIKKLQGIYNTAYSHAKFIKKNPDIPIMAIPDEVETNG